MQHRNGKYVLSMTVDDIFSFLTSFVTATGNSSAEISLIKSTFAFAKQTQKSQTAINNIYMIIKSECGHVDIHFYVKSLLSSVCSNFYKKFVYIVCGATENISML